MSVDIGPMTRADLAGVEAIARASMPEAWTREGFASELERDTSIALVMRDDARPIAFAIGMAVVGELEIATIAVAPDARRRGVGRALLRALLVSARARGVTRAFLEVRASNAAAIALYAAHGFGVSGRRAKYYADGEDAVLMASALAT